MKINTEYQAIFTLFFKRLLVFMKVKYFEIFRKFYWIFMPFYTGFILYLMFFGFGRNQYDFNIVRLLPLFSTIGFVSETIALKTIFINVFGNIAMFAPFGFLGLIFPTLNQFKALIINFLSAIIVIESLQYFTRLGVFDIDDIILNSAGVALGFFVYQKAILHQD